VEKNGVKKTKEVSMKAKGFIIVIFMVFLAGMFVGTGWCASSEKPIELSYNTIFPPVHPEFKLIEDWARLVEKRANGRVKITVYPENVLSPPPNVYDSVVSGMADIGVPILGYTRGRFPVMAIIDLPLGYPNGVIASRVANRFYQQFKPKELDEVKVLRCDGNTPSILHTRSKPVRTLEDLKGLKIRGTGPAADFIKALGAVPVSLSQGETYEALQRGLVDGNIVAPEALMSYKQAEVIKYTTESYCIAMVAGGARIVNLKKWNSLPKDIQDVLQQVTDEWSDVRAKGWAEADKKGLEFSLKRGNQIIPLSEAECARWKKAVEPAIDKYVADMNAKGLPGKQYIDFMYKLISEETKAYKP
jgi:TRAP-type C4-dicarboxylate transport system substrate-binding protein